MSNDYYNNSTNTLVTLDNARATDVEGKFDEVVTGFALLPGEEKLKRETLNFINLAGSATNYTAALTYTPTAYIDGMHIVARVNITNTGSTTVNVDSLGVKAIKRKNGATLTAGDMTAGQFVDLRYDSANGYFILMTY